MIEEITPREIRAALVKVPHCSEWHIQLGHKGNRYECFSSIPVLGQEEPMDVVVNVWNTYEKKSTYVSPDGPSWVELWRVKHRVSTPFPMGHMHHVALVEFRKEISTALSKIVPRPHRASTYTRTPI